ncbi:MAG: hypothetical protein Alpg2KO_32660 [Alphaproteobacteria bacterium]
MLSIARRWLFAPLLCMLLPGSIIALGWMERTMLHHGDDPPPPLLFGKLGKSVFADALRSFSVGLVSLLHGMIWTLPGGVILLLCWWGGWTVSFYKAYEQSWMGATGSFVGIALLLLGLLHLPAADARRMATGDLREALRPAMIRQIMAYHPIKWAWLSSFQALIGAITAFAALFLLGMGDDLPPNAGPEELEKLKNQAGLMMLGLCVFGFSARRWLKGWALRLHQSGLDRLVVEGPRTRWHPLVLIGLVWRLSAWFGFVAALYVSQFVNYIWFMFLHHPALHAPWFNLLAPQ